MRVIEIVADLHVDDIDRAKQFYVEYLGLSAEEFDLGWVARYASPETGVKLQLVTHDATAPTVPVVTVKVNDVDAAYGEAHRHGFEIVHPLQDEPWGVRRFFVRVPDGNVVNIVRHRA